MSGYGGGRRGYDSRERSPSRRRDRDYPRSDERQDRDRGHDRAHGRGRAGERFDDRSGDRRGHRDYDDNSSTKSTLPSLPSNVDIPQAGRELPLTRLKPKSSASRGTVLTNHFKIKSLPTITIHEYDIKFEIPPDSQRPAGKNEVTPMLKKKVFDHCSEQLALGASFVFDGISTGWSTHDLLEGNSVGTKRANLPGHSLERPNQIEVTLRNNGSVDTAGLVESFSVGKAVDAARQMMWLNSLFRDDPARRYMAKPRGLQYYMREPGLFQPLASTGGVLEALRGFHQSVSNRFGLLSINVDTSCTAFYAPDMPMIEVIKAFTGLRDLSHLGGVNWREISDLMKGMVVYVVHRGEVGTSKRIKIKALCQKSANQAEFEQLDRVTGKTVVVTVQDYFQKKYSISLQYPHLPLLDTASGLLPPELCKTAAGERYKEVLEGKETADFIKFATAPAFVRSQQVMESVKRLAWHTKAKIAANGLSVEPQMLQVEACRVPIPSPTYAGAQKASIRDGVWNLRGQTFVRPSSFNAWGFIYFPPPNARTAASMPEIQNFMKTMYNSLQQYGVRVPKEAPSQLTGNARGSIHDAMKHIVERTRSESGIKDVLIFCFVHDGAPVELYKTIKTITEVELGTPCQVLKIEKSVRGRGQAQYCANVAMKVNLKIGGSNAEVQDSLLKKYPVLMIGGDVNHPSPSQLKSATPPPSFIALSGSNDMYASRYTAVAAATPATVELMAGTEMSDAFPAMVEELVKRFFNKTRAKPQKVIYWRDGVSDSQESQLLATEVKAMKAKFDEMSLNAKLTVILAVKRHHTRFFPTNRNDGDKLGNVLPGTVIESGDKSAFVVGHGALQGTVRPTHFKIVFDENDLSTDDFHRLVLHGCYSYGKATRGVHTHAAIYYADQIAERSRARLRVLEDGGMEFRDVHQDLRLNTMWWQ